MCKVRNLIWSECKLGRGRSQSKRCCVFRSRAKACLPLFAAVNGVCRAGSGDGGALPAALQRHEEALQGLPLTFFALALPALARPFPPRADGDEKGWRVWDPTPVSSAAFPRRFAEPSACRAPSRERGTASTCPHCAGTSPLLWSRNIPLLILPRACHVLFTPTEDARRQKSIFFFSLRQRCFIFLEGLCFLLERWPISWPL